MPDGDIAINIVEVMGITVNDILKITQLPKGSSYLVDVNANMENAKKKIQEVVNAGAELVLFPEFFTTGFVFTPELLDAVLKYENPQIKLSKWAKEFNVIIGGSYLMLNGEDASNTFSR